MAASITQKLYDKILSNVPSSDPEPPIAERTTPQKPATMSKSESSYDYANPRVLDRLISARDSITVLGLGRSLATFAQERRTRDLTHLKQEYTQTIETHLSQGQDIDTAADSSAPLLDNRFSNPNSEDFFVGDILNPIRVKETDQIAAHQRATLRHAVLHNLLSESHSLTQESYKALCTIRTERQQDFGLEAKALTDQETQWAQNAHLVLTTKIDLLKELISSIHQTYQGETSSVKKVGLLQQATSLQKQLEGCDAKTAPSFWAALTW